MQSSLRAQNGLCKRVCMCITRFYFALIIKMIVMKVYKCFYFLFLFLEKTSCEASSRLCDKLLLLNYKIYIDKMIDSQETSYSSLREILS